MAVIQVSRILNVSVAVILLIGFLYLDPSGVDIYNNGPGESNDGGNLNFLVEQGRRGSRRGLATYDLVGEGGLLIGNRFEDYRFLAFGTSRTWGAGIPNRNLSYPHLLSPNASNYAIRAAGPQIPAMCTYSMVGDDIYDVIIFEFYYHANNYLKVLAKRLRKRFPKAMFLFLKIWSPFQFRSASKFNGHRLTNVVQMNISKKEYTDESFRRLVGLFEDDELVFSTRHDAEKMIRELSNAVGGHVITQQLDPTRATKYLHKFGPMFVHDTIHFSEYGHRWIRNGIVGILNHNHALKSDEVNPWDFKDNCVSWFDSGDVSGLEYDPRLVLNEFSVGKYALEIHNLTESWITVTNSMDKPAEVFVSYMVRGPDIKTYPTMRITLEGSLDQSEGVFVNPNVNGAEHPFRVHLVEMSSLGTIDPGTSTITFRQEEGNVDPFRIVGVVITSPMNEDALDKTSWAIVSPLS